MTQSYESPPDDEIVNIRQAVRALVVRWRLAAGAAAVIIVAGVLFTFIQKPTYRASTTLLIEADDQQDPFAEIMKLQGTVPVATEIEVLKSRTLAEFVVRELGLDVVAIEKPEEARIRVRNFSLAGLDEDGAELRFVFETPVTFTVIAPDGAKRPKGRIGEDYKSDGLSFLLYAEGVKAGDEIAVEAILFDDAVSNLAERLTIEEVAASTNVVQVSADTPIATLSANIVNTLAKGYIAQNVEQKTREARQTTDFVEKQLESIRAGLEQGESELRQFKSQHGIFLLSEQAEKVIGRLSELEASKTELEVQARQIGALSRTLKKTAGPLDPYLIGQLSLADPVLVPMVTEYSARVNELNGLRKELTDDHARVVALKTQITNLQGQIRALVDNTAGAMTSRQAAVGDMIARYEDQLRGLPLAEQQLASLVRKSTVNAELYTFLLTKHEESRIVQAAIVANARVVDPALVPRKPIKPNVPLNLAVSLVFGVLGGVTLALFFDFLDDGIKHVDDIEAQLGMSVYGLIPAVEAGKPASLEGDEAFAEAFRVLRTNIVYSHGDKPKKVLMFTSSIPGEGKTTVTYNLAAMLAQGGSRVLLVDADLRRPQVHARLNLPQEPGLTNFVYDKTPVTLGLGHETAPGLRVVTAGMRPPNHAEFVNSAGFKDFVVAASRVFDFVLIDVPPAVAFSDAAIVSTLADGVYVVIEMGKSQRVLVKRALSALANVNVKVNGAVANKLDRNSRLGSHYYYAEYYERQGAAPESLLARLARRLGTYFDSV